jgi:UDP-glucose 4-epimerase
MRALIIGGAGYIGSHVAREFLDQGHEVTVLDNLSSGTKENLCLDETFVQGDIRNADEVRAVMKRGFDGVVHLAAFKHVGQSMTDPEKFAVNNITGTINILNAMTEFGVKHMVFSSTAALFGEPQYLPLDEKHPNNPPNFYGFTKLEIERLMAWYDELKGLKYCALRYFNASGYDVKGRVTGLEQGTFNLIPVLMEVASGIRDHAQIFGTDYPTRDGSCIRDFIHVNDLATAHLLAMKHLMSGRPSEVFNLGTGNGTSVLEMLKLAREVTGHPIPAVMSPRRPGDSSSLYAAAAKAHEMLGWQPKHSDLKTILETTWKAYQKHTTPRG